VREKRNDENQNEYLMNIIREDEREKVKYRIVVALQELDDQQLIDRVLRAVGWTE